MAHLSQHTAIFSPSVARQAASTAKDWAFVDGWLATRYGPNRAPPPFERNPDTLKALLALASLNEAADERRTRLARLEADSLAALPDDDDDDDKSFGDGLLLPALEDHLTREGAAALEAMAAAAVGLGVAATPDPATLASAMLHLQTRAFDLEQAEARTAVLRRYVEAEAARVQALLDDMAADDAYRAPVDLARQNVDMQRKVRAMGKKLPEMQSKVASLARSVGVPNPTIDQVRVEEERYLELLEVKRALDRQIGEFEGLPPDLDMARRELDSLRRELQAVTQRRDAVFEGLVERETPRKAR